MHLQWLVLYLFMIVRKIYFQQVPTHVSEIKRKNVLREKIVEALYLNGVIAVFLVST